MSASGGVVTREAHEGDVPAIQSLFKEVYGGDYPYQGFFDDWWLKRSIFGDDILLLVATDEDSDEVLGTASLVFDVGSHSDLSAEFGRLAVSQAARGRGVGRLLMEARVEHARTRIQVGVVENRTAHTFSQRISESHGFVPVGFLPLKIRFRVDESIALYCRHFGSAFELRRNHPRVLPEVADLAALSLANVGLANDVIVDDDARAYTCEDELVVESLDDRGLPSLIRIERGRVRHREVFGPMRLHYGFFQLTARRATYLVARRPVAGGAQGPIAGAIGYIHDEFEDSVKVFESISQTDAAIRFLFGALVERCREWGVRYLEVDVTAHAPRLQRTLLELGFLPAAYVPALVFRDTERHDVVRMVRLFIPLQLGEPALVPAAREVADRVLEPFVRRSIRPRVAAACGTAALFSELDEDQTERLASEFDVEEFAAGAELFAPGAPAERMFLLLSGHAAVRSSTGVELGSVGPGEVLGELSLMTREPHSARAVAAEPVVAGVLDAEGLGRLVRRRPDVGVALYRQLAIGLGRKLQRVDERLGERSG